MSEANNNFLEDASKATGLAGKIHSIAGNSAAAKVYERIGEGLDIVLIAENTINIIDKYGYEAGMVYLGKEVKNHYGLDATVGTGAVQAGRVLYAIGARSTTLTDGIAGAAEALGAGDLAKQIRVKNILSNGLREAGHNDLADVVSSATKSAAVDAYATEGVLAGAGEFILSSVSGLGFAVMAGDIIYDVEKDVAEYEKYQDSKLSIDELQTKISTLEANRETLLDNVEPGDFAFISNESDLEIARNILEYKQILEAIEPKVDEQIQQLGDKLEMCLNPNAEVDYKLSSLIDNIVQNSSQSGTQETLRVIRRDPLTLDLDGDGIETVSADGSVLFDSNADGVKRGTGWVAA